MNSAFFNNHDATPVQYIEYVNHKGDRINLWVKRDDLIDNQISGNKWRKLKYNVKHAVSSGYKGIASFGGAFSNHIAALAAAGQRAKIPTIGFIRGHELDLDNPTLKLAQQFGMKLINISREEYRLRHNKEFLDKLTLTYPGYFFVPEGGSNDKAEEGLEELATEISSDNSYDYVASAIGSGGTIRGLMNALPQQKFIGVATVKDTPLLKGLNQEFESQLTLNQEALFGGYAKFNEVLEDFCLDFFSQTAIPIEPIYTGKLFYALCHQQPLMALSPESKILAIHTGGLQGLKGLIYRHQIASERWQQVISSLAV